MALTPDTVQANLQTIQTKVRRLTRSLAESQLSTTELNNYINTFVLYDFPEHLRLFNLKETFTFFTEPYVDTYETSTNVNNPLYDFKNRYLTVHQPFYIAGKPVNFYESREMFYSIYPLWNNLQNLNTSGDAVTTAFNGTLPINQGGSNTPGSILILRNNVVFASKTAALTGVSMIDFPISNTIGNLYVPGTDPTSTTVQDPVNFINYSTGVFVVTFPTPPGSGQAITAEYVLTQPTLPQSVLFFDGKFVIRPVPDKVYRVQCEVFVRPTELLATSDNPKLKEWWQYIAYGAAKKVFEDRMDLESVQMIMPEFKEQQRLIERRTIVQQTSQRTPTIYTDQFGPNGLGNSNGFGSGNGQF